MLNRRSAELAEAMASSDQMVDDFLLQLEQWIIDGYSYAARRRMAFAEFGMDKPTVDKVEDLIKAGWKAEQIDPEFALGRKNVLRLRYVSIFRQANESGDLKLALRTLDSMAKLEGLWSSGDVTVHVDARGDVSSRNRERVAELLEKMRDLASGRKKLGSPSIQAKEASFGLKRAIAENMPRPRPGDDEGSS